MYQRRPRQRVHLGAVDYTDRAASALLTAKVLLDDPALPEITVLVSQLYKLEATAPGPPAPGIGLRRLVSPLRMYVAYRRNPFLGWAALAVILGIPFFLGRMTKR